MLSYRSFKKPWLKLCLSVSLIVFTTSGIIPFSGDAVDLTGTWKAEIDTEIGLQKYTYVLKQEGTVLTGTIISNVEGEKKETALLEGKVIDGVITFVEVMNFQDFEIRISYKGKLEGEVINFTREVGEFATETFVAKREEEEAATSAK